MRGSKIRSKRTWSESNQPHQITDDIAKESGQGLVPGGGQIRAQIHLQPKGNVNNSSFAFQAQDQLRYMQGKHCLLEAVCSDQPTNQPTRCRRIIH